MTRTILVDDVAGMLETLLKELVQNGITNYPDGSNESLAAGESQVNVKMSKEQAKRILCSANVGVDPSVVDGW